MDAFADDVSDHDELDEGEVLIPALCIHLSIRTLYMKCFFLFFFYAALVS